MIDVTICDNISCGECGEESNGCKHIFALTKAAAGSASTPADVLWSNDGGVNWYATNVDSLSPASTQPNALACIGLYVVVVSRTGENLHFALKSEIEAIGDEDWTAVATGFVAGKGPNDIWSVGEMAFIVGQGGYIYKVEDPANGVTVLDAGAQTVDNLYAVHALDEQFAVAVGGNGAILRTEDGENWEALTRFTPILTDFTTVWLKNELEWFVGTSTGRLYYTVDGGTTWVEKVFSGSGAGKVWNLAFSTNSIGYMAHAAATPRGRIFRTLDGGYSWTILPERVGSTLPLNDRISALAACSFDVNFLVGGGLADNGSGGILLVGSD